MINSWGFIYLGYKFIFFHTCVFINGEGSQAVASSDGVFQRAISSFVIILRSDCEDTRACTRVLLHWAPYSKVREVGCKQILINIHDLKKNALCNKCFGVWNLHKVLI